MDKIEKHKLKQIRFLTILFIIGLVLSGATAIPIEWQLDKLVGWLGLSGQSPDQFASGTWQHWLLWVRQGVAEMNQKYPFMSYGGDWLAFGHFGIAIVFLWAVRDPVKHRFLFDYGLILCLLLLPYALVFGHFRGVPIWWRGIDSLFGIIGAIPIYLARRIVYSINNPDLSAPRIR